MNQSILKTLCYADVFDCALTEREIYQYLIGEKKLSKRGVGKSLSLLKKSGKVSSAQEFSTLCGKQEIYFLPEREVIADHKFSREEFSRNKINKTRKVSGMLYKIPGLVAVFVTGSVAIKNAKVDDDIDLLLICETGKLWQTRLLVTATLEATFSRRKPNDVHQGAKVRDKYCPNMYIDESMLAMGKKRQNLYTAHELVQAQVLFDKRDIASQLLQKNRWIHNFLPPFPHSPTFD